MKEVEQFKQQNIPPSDPLDEARLDKLLNLPFTRRNFLKSAVCFLGLKVAKKLPIPPLPSIRDQQPRLKKESNPPPPSIETPQERIIRDVNKEALQLYSTSFYESIISKIGNLPISDNLFWFLALRAHNPKVMDTLIAEGIINITWLNSKADLEALNTAFTTLLTDNESFKALFQKGELNFHVVDITAAGERSRLIFITPTSSNLPTHVLKLYPVNSRLAPLTEDFVGIIRYAWKDNPTLASQVIYVPEIKIENTIYRGYLTPLISSGSIAENLIGNAISLERATRLFQKAYLTYIDLATTYGIIPTDPNPKNWLIRKETILSPETVLMIDPDTMLLILPSGEKEFAQAVATKIFWQRTIGWARGALSKEVAPQLEKLLRDRLLEVIHPRNELCRRVIKGGMRLYVEVRVPHPNSSDTSVKLAIPTDALPPNAFAASGELTPEAYKQLRQQIIYDQQNKRWILNTEDRRKIYYEASPLIQNKPPSPDRVYRAMQEADDALSTTRFIFFFMNLTSLLVELANAIQKEHQWALTFRCSRLITAPHACRVDGSYQLEYDIFSLRKRIERAIRYWCEFLFQSDILKEDPRLKIAEYIFKIKRYEIDALRTLGIPEEEIRSFLLTNAELNPMPVLIEVEGNIAIPPAYQPTNLFLWPLIREGKIEALWLIAREGDKLSISELILEDPIIQITTPDNKLRVYHPQKPLNNQITLATSVNTVKVGAPPMYNIPPQEQSVRFTLVIEGNRLVLKMSPIRNKSSFNLGLRNFSLSTIPSKNIIHNNMRKEKI